jgi:hypothetical protein
LGGNKGDLSSRNAPAGVYLSGGGEESESVTDFDNFIILDLSVRATRHDLKKIQIRADGRCRQAAKLLARHMPQRHVVFVSINPNLEVLMLRRVLVMVLPAVRWSMGLVSLFAHWNLLVMMWYHDTKAS